MEMPIVEYVKVILSLEEDLKKHKDFITLAGSFTFSLREMPLVFNAAVEAARENIEHLEKEIQEMKDKISGYTVVVEK